MKIGVLTSSRADFGIYLPLLEALEQSSDFTLTIFAFGTHVSPIFGETLQEIIDHGFRHIVALPDIINDKYGPQQIAQQMGETTILFANQWSEHPQDFVLALGDRFEMLAAVSSLIPFNTPIAHFHGGEITMGAYDDKFRHAITKLSDYHFCACDIYRNRIIAMGASPQTVFNVGALSLAKLNDLKLFTLEEFETKFGIDLRKKTFLVTYHPVTRSSDQSKYFVEEFCRALTDLDGQILITQSGLDTATDIFNKTLKAFAKQNATRVTLVSSLGARGYFSAMNYCSIMLGNSSSGILESTSFNIPVVNIGDRQAGRERNDNVIDVGHTSDKILAGVKQATAMIGKKFTNQFYQSDTVSRVLTVLRSMVEKLDDIKV